jgi:hypothetical protein
MSLFPILSFASLDEAHYLATGEHLPHREGNEAPLPLEHHIKITQQRQQRKRLWEILDEVLLSGREVKPGMVNGVRYTRATRHEDQIHIFDEQPTPVMILTADGVEPSDASIPSSPVPFTLQHCFEIGEEDLLKEHAAAKEEWMHANEHLSSVQAALRMRHIGRH